jgi:hypothetical protein
MLQKQKGVVRRDKPAGSRGGQPIFSAIDPQSRTLSAQGFAIDSNDIGTYPEKAGIFLFQD